MADKSLLSNLDDLAETIITEAKLANTPLDDKINAFNSVAKFLAIKNKIDPDDSNASVVDGFASRLKEVKNAEEEEARAARSRRSGGRKRIQSDADAACLPATGAASGTCSTANPAWSADVARDVPNPFENGSSDRSGASPARASVPIPVGGIHPGPILSSRPADA